MAATVGEEQPAETDDKSERLYNVQNVATNQMLQYELTIFSDLQADDGLVVTAK